MKLYQIEGRVAKFGIGQEFTLDADQIKSRTHALEVGKKSGDRVLVKATAPVEFKAGEVIGLSEAPKYLADALVEVSAADLKKAAKEKVQAEKKPAKPRKPAKSRKAKRGEQNPGADDGGAGGQQQQSPE